MLTLQQVVAEIPGWSRQERRELCLKLLELDCTQEEADDLAVCEQTAVMGFALLDEMEAEGNPP